MIGLDRQERASEEITLAPRLEGFTFIPAGKGKQGYLDREKIVDLSGFYISDHITVGEYFEMVREMRDDDALIPIMYSSKATRMTYDLLRANGFTDAHPMLWLAQENVEAYASWLSERMGVPVYVPSEAQVRRAGGEGCGWRYPMGDRFDPLSTNVKTYIEEYGSKGLSSIVRVEENHPARSIYGWPMGDVSTACYASEGGFIRLFGNHNEESPNAHLISPPYAKALPAGSAGIMYWW